jgi:hypothetical protein
VGVAPVEVEEEIIETVGPEPSPPVFTGSEAAPPPPAPISEAPPPQEPQPPPEEGLKTFHTGYQPVTQREKAPAPVRLEEGLGRFVRKTGQGSLEPRDVRTRKQNLAALKLVFQNLNPNSDWQTVVGRLDDIHDDLTFDEAREIAEANAPGFQWTGSKESSEIASERDIQRQAEEYERENT